MVFVNVSNAEICLLKIRKAVAIFWGKDKSIGLDKLRVQLPAGPLLRNIGKLSLAYLRGD